MTEFPHLLSPLRISSPGGVLEVRNRVLVSAHVPGFAENNKPGKKYIDYHQRYAAQGVGLQITGGTPVHHSGLLSLGTDGLRNLDDSIIPGYQRLAEAVHSEGGKMLAQLAHSGGTVLINQPGITSWSASENRSAITGGVAHAMSVDEIAEVIDAHARAAARVRDAGLDGVEILAAFGFLPQAFLSPLTNHRTDHYGGSEANRLRFLVELLSAVRVELGPGQILGVRLPGDEFETGGLDLAQMQSICGQLDQQRLVDYFNVIAHTNFTHTGRSRHWAPTPTPHGVFVDLAAAVKTVVQAPVFTVGRIVDPRHAESILAAGKADMVGMTRAHICDPTIVSKVVQNRLAEIRPCVGANTCIASRYAGKSIKCMHNPELNSPGVSLLPAVTRKKVVVIGAGPAGLEVARLCASRGHQVNIHEASDRVGGQLDYWSRVNSMTELRRIIDWRISELSRLEVGITLGSKITAEDIDRMDVDELVVATGARERNRLSGLSSDVPVLTPRQLLDLASVNVKNAIVISDGRGQAGLVAAEWLLNRGVRTEIITEDIAVANDLDATNRNAWYQRLGNAGAVFSAQLEPMELVDSELTLRNVYSQIPEVRSEIDLVVDWCGCHAVDELLRDSGTSQGSARWHGIGDCMAPRNVEVAMAEALSVAALL
ncbi:MAG: FAD-dependent oxidoreductase [Granulosicoccus sp.]|nr:FAD-dependent oxidoreductase [Granulosicoccus sp.]